MATLLRKRITRFAYGAILSSLVIGGTAPAILNFTVDPFEFFQTGQHDKRRNEQTEKTHYPLWKFARYQNNAEIVVLGDSRARALRDKYWREYAAAPTFNFAYGGGTIPEIYATFQAVKDDPKLKKLVVGIQLRSFDETHKDGLNRVPEARKATQSAFSYLTNWFVARRSWALFEEDNSNIAGVVRSIVPNVVGRAFAADLGTPGSTRVDTLLQPDVCFGCELPEGGELIEPPKTKGPNLGLGRDTRGQNTTLNGSLPKKFIRQVTKNAASDWKGFQFSERYFRMIEEIARWAHAREGRQVIFVIPPTIVEMQATIETYGLSSLNQTFRERLANLGPVVDFDYGGELTRNASNFSDAYHFNAKVARAIVGEIMVVQGTNSEQAKLIEKRRRSDVICPNSQIVTSSETKEVVATGQNCRVWGGQEK